MREIKFRAWLKGRMVYITPDDDYFIDGDGRLVKIEQNENGCKYQGFEDRECNLMQYTGLKDKNGKEIFEGDVIVTSAKPGSKKYVVEYSEHGEWCIGIFLLSSSYDTCEVIGNMYENPELLEESQNGTK